MPLTGLLIRNAKPGPKPIRLTDGQDLLLIQPSGAPLDSISILAHRSQADFRAVKNPFSRSRPKVPFDTRAIGFYNAAL